MDGNEEGNGKLAPRPRLRGSEPGPENRFVGRGIAYVNRENPIIFDVRQLYADFEAKAKSKKISVWRAGRRIGIDQGTMHNIKTNATMQIRVHTLVKMLHFMENYDIEKYVIEGD